MSHADTATNAETIDKRFRTLQAKLALQGFALQIISDRETGDAVYLVGRWGHFHELPNWAALVDWASRAGGAP